MREVDLFKEIQVPVEQQLSSLCAAEALPVEAPDPALLGDRNLQPRNCAALFNASNYHYEYRLYFVWLPKKTRGSGEA